MTLNTKDHRRNNACGFAVEIIAVLTECRVCITLKFITACEADNASQPSLTREEARVRTDLSDLEPVCLTSILWK